jgi:hypothetical protein
MKRFGQWKRVFLGSSLVLTAAVAQGGVKGEIEVKYLMPGVSLGNAKMVSAQALAARELRMKVRREAKQELFKAVAAATEGARKSFQDAVASDPALKAGLQLYESDLQQLKRLAGLAQMKRAIADLQRKHQPLFAKIFAKGKIDEKRYQKKAEEAVYKASAHHGFQGKKYRIVWEQYLSFYLQWVNHEALSTEPELETLDITLSAPFPDVQKEGAKAQANPERGIYTAEVSTYFGGMANSLAGLGHFVDIPGGYDQILVTAALPNTEYQTVAFALGGASGASVSSTVEIFKNNVIVCEQSFDHATAWAVVGWLSSEVGTDTYNISCSANAPSDDTEVVLSFYGEAETWAGGIADSIAKVTATPRDLKIRLNP